MAKKVETVVSVQTEFQKILITRDPQGLFLTLNGVSQVHSREERLYHECIATLPMLLARNIDNILILGGGDGLAARDILAFSGAKKVTLVEIDPKMIQICSENPEWSALNEGALKNPRLNVIVGDAIQWFLDTDQTFDLIIHDAEVGGTDQPQALTAEREYELYTLSQTKLRPGGLWVLTIAHVDTPVIQDALFAHYREQFPEAAQRVYMRKRNAISKTRVLLDGVFPHVRQWTARFRHIGPHTTFYVSNAPFRLHRRPAKPMVRPNAFQKLA